MDPSEQRRRVFALPSQAPLRQTEGWTKDKQRPHTGLLRDPTYHVHLGSFRSRRHVRLLLTLGLCFMGAQSPASGTDRQY